MVRQHIESARKPHQQQIRLDTPYPKKSNQEKIVIDQEHLKVGNEVFTANHGSAVITKIGRKYTYTTNGHLIIENSRLMTKHTGHGVSTYRVYKSESDYMKALAETKFINAVKYSADYKINWTLSEAEEVNKILKLGVTND